jgi:hypothetical protein
MAAAYAVANGKPIKISDELYTAKQINRYGVLAIYGRPLTHREIVAIDTAELVRTVYDSLDKSDQDWAVWALDNPEMSAFLNMSMAAAHEQGYITEG